MKRRSAIALLVAGFTTLAYAPQASSETGWTTLFDGKSLDGFTKVGDANWRVEDGMIVRPVRVGSGTRVSSSVMVNSGA